MIRVELIVAIAAAVVVTVAAAGWVGVRQRRTQRRLRHALGVVLAHVRLEGDDRASGEFAGLRVSVQRVQTVLAYEVRLGTGARRFTAATGVPSDHPLAHRLRACGIELISCDCLRGLLRFGTLDQLPRLLAERLAVIGAIAALHEVRAVAVSPGQATGRMPRRGT